MHLRHLERTLGVTFNIATLAFAHLQEQRDAPVQDEGAS